MGKILKGEDYKKRIDLKTKVEFEDRANVFDVAEPSVVVSREALDTQAKVRGILEEATAEAAQIKKEARELLGQVHEEMEKSKKKGEEQGFQEGLGRALEYLNKIHLLREKMFQNVEPQVVKLVFNIAEKVIGQQIQESDAILGVVRQALDAAIGQKIVVRVNPSDYQKVKEHEATLLSRVEATKTISFKEDDAVKMGGCVVESEVGTIDAQLDTQVAAIKKALGL
jgi:type III secretion system HrpE/YscL family protein